MHMHYICPGPLHRCAGWQGEEGWLGGEGRGGKGAGGGEGWEGGTGRRVAEGGGGAGGRQGRRESSCHAVFIERNVQLTKLLVQ